MAGAAPPRGRLWPEPRGTTPTMARALAPRLVAVKSTLAVTTPIAVRAEMAAVAQIAVMILIADIMTQWSTTVFAGKATCRR